MARSGYVPRVTLFILCLCGGGAGVLGVNSGSQQERAAGGLLGKDCQELAQASASPLADGVYTVTTLDGLGTIDVYCEMTGGEEWTVIQRRIDGKESFYRGWAEYEFGFGDLNHEFWLGNDKISRLTAQTNYELRIEMEDFKANKIFADYESFLVHNASLVFQLQVSGFSGDKGDSLRTHNHMMFSTHDFDIDRSSQNCAKIFKAGWWFNDCMSANLNGNYMENIPSHGIVWETYQNVRLKSVTMKIRPRKLGS